MNPGIWGISLDMSLVNMFLAQKNVAYQGKNFLTNIMTLAIFGQSFQAQTEDISGKVLPA